MYRRLVACLFHAGDCLIILPFVTLRGRRLARFTAAEFIYIVYRAPGFRARCPAPKPEPELRVA